MNSSGFPGQELVPNWSTPSQVRPSPENYNKCTVGSLNNPAISDQLRAANHISSQMLSLNLIHSDFLSSGALHASLFIMRKQQLFCHTDYYKTLDWTTKDRQRGKFCMLINS